MTDMYKAAGATSIPVGEENISREGGTSTGGRGSREGNSFLGVKAAVWAAVTPVHAHLHAQFPIPCNHSHSGDMATPQKLHLVDRTLTRTTTQHTCAVQLPCNDLLWKHNYFSSNINSYGSPARYTCFLLRILPHYAVFYRILPYTAINDRTACNRVFRFIRVHLEEPTSN